MVGIKKDLELVLTNGDVIDINLRAYKKKMDSLEKQIEEIKKALEQGNAQPVKMSDAPKQIEGC